MVIVSLCLTAHRSLAHDQSYYPKTAVLSHTDLFPLSHLALTFRINQTLYFDIVCFRIVSFLCHLDTSLSLLSFSTVTPAAVSLNHTNSLFCENQLFGGMSHRGLD